MLVRRWMRCKCRRAEERTNIVWTDGRFPHLFPAAARATWKGALIHALELEQPRSLHPHTLHTMASDDLERDLTKASVGYLSKEECA